MVLNRKPEEIENLIIIQLFKHGEQNFTDLLENIHVFQREQKKLNNHSEFSGTELSKPTLSYYLEKLIKKDKIVERKKGKTAKRWNYALTTETQNFSADIALNLLKSSESVKKLYSSIDRPFLGFLQEISEKDKKQLIEIRDNLRKTARMLDFYLKFSEVKA